MANQVKQLEDGKIEAILETGEKFVGDPLEVTNKLAEAKVNTRRHYEQQMQVLQQQLQQQQAPPPPAAPASTAEEANLQRYLADQNAKYFGYQTAEEMKADLGRMKEITETSANDQIASDFLLACPDFPNTKEAIAAISSIVDQNSWQYRPQDLMAAHMLAVRNNLYQPLTVEQQNAAWTQGMQAANRSQAPPPPAPPGQAPDARGSTMSEWAMPLDDLRKKVLSGGQ